MRFRLSWLLGIPASVGLAGAGLAVFSVSVARRAERALPPLGRFVDIDGARVHYIDEGGAPDAPALLMIHGIGGQMRNFTFGLVEPLSRHHRVVVIDRPGSGYSSRPAGTAATLGAQAELVASFIGALGLKRPILVGHSLGGAIALAVALNHPEAVGGLALIAPLTHPQDTPPDGLAGLAIRSSIRRRLVAWTIAVPSAIRNRNYVIDQVFGPDPMPSDYPMRGGGLLSLRPSSFYGASTDLVRCGADLPGMVARYGSIAIPVGVLYGTADRILDHAAHGVAMRDKVPGLEVELIEGAGHMLPVTAPEQTASFIERITGRAAA